MRQRAREFELNADRLTREVALAVDSAVVLGTPVDTGRARSNWQVELNSAPSGVVDSHGGNAAQSSMDKAAEKIETYDGDTHTSIHITNNLPYIGRLNDGSSAQAPSGFVEAAVEAGSSRVRGVRLLISRTGRA